MKRRLALIFLVAAVVSALTAPAAVGNGDNGTGNAPVTYALSMTDPNGGQAPNGDRVSVWCTAEPCGTFTTKDKNVTMSGFFAHTDSQGNALGGGTWVATQLISFDPYGCGVLAGTPIPSDICGGALKLRVLLVGSQQLEGVLTIFCVAGENPPNSHDEEIEEGVTLNIPGVINFNHVYEMEHNHFVRLP